MKAAVLIPVCIGLLSFSVQAIDDDETKAELLANPFEYSTVFTMDNPDDGILYVKINNRPINFKNEEQRLAHSREDAVPNIAKDFNKNSEFYQYFLNRLLVDFKRLRPGAFINDQRGDIDKSPENCGIPSAFYKELEGLSDQLYATPAGWVNILVAFLPMSSSTQSQGRRLSDYTSVFDLMKLVHNRFWTTAREENERLHPTYNPHSIPFGMYM